MGCAGEHDRHFLIGQNSQIWDLHVERVEHCDRSPGFRTEVARLETIYEPPLLRKLVSPQHSALCSAQVEKVFLLSVLSDGARLDGVSLARWRVGQLTVA